MDASLPQLVESARAKVDYQFQRLLEGLAGKVRHRLEREHPEWPRLRHYLLPGDRLQERRLASLEVVAYRGARRGGRPVRPGRRRTRARSPAASTSTSIVEL